MLGRAMPLEDGEVARRRGQHAGGATGLGGTRGEPHEDGTAPGGSGMEVTAEEPQLGPALGDGDVAAGRGEDAGGGLQPAGKEPEQFGVLGGEESLMAELSERVQKVVKSSSWWERHGVDASILACSLLALPAGRSPPEPGGPGGGVWGSCCLHAAVNSEVCRAGGFAESLLAAVKL